MHYLCEVFEQCWTHAEPFSDAVTDGLEAVAKDIDRTIVRLLAAGMKDETIARRLGMSLRTARKHIADIMETLGRRAVSGRCPRGPSRSARRRRRGRGSGLIRPRPVPGSRYCPGGHPPLPARYREPGTSECLPCTRVHATPQARRPLDGRHPCPRTCGGRTQAPPVPDVPCARDGSSAPRAASHAGACSSSTWSRRARGAAPRGRHPPGAPHAGPT
ncbi:helix-turn-helix transcriptional regulator [Streptomyces sp. M19]